MEEMDWKKKCDHYLEESERLDDFADQIKTFMDEVDPSIIDSETYSELSQLKCKILCKSLELVSKHFEMKLTEWRKATKKSGELVV